MIRQDTCLFLTGSHGGGSCLLLLLFSIFSHRQVHEPLITFPLLIPQSLFPGIAFRSPSSVILVLCNSLLVKRIGQLGWHKRVSLENGCLVFLQSQHTSFLFLCLCSKVLMDLFFFCRGLLFWVLNPLSANRPADKVRQSASHSAIVCPSPFASFLLFSLFRVPDDKRGYWSRVLYHLFQV